MNCHEKVDSARHDCTSRNHQNLSSGHGYGYIWRPTANSDVGLDGEIELVEDRAATAKIVKVQVKSGASYFRREDQRSFELHASADDVEYWRQPVIRYYLLSIILRKIQFSVSMYKSILRSIPRQHRRACAWA